MTDEIFIQPWKRLEGKIASPLMVTPKTCVDPYTSNEWPNVEEMVVSYFERTVVGKPWADFMALVILVQTANRRQANTIYTIMSIMAPRFTEIFQALGIHSMTQWNATEILKSYLLGELLPENTVTQRYEFWGRYLSTSLQVNRWLKSLPPDQQEIYKCFALPVPDRAALFHIKKLRAEVSQQAKRNRKVETDAMVPNLPLLRAKAHLRFNRITRLRQAYYDAIKAIQINNHELPFSYYYDEGEDKEQKISAQERFHFRIWDRRSFVLSHPNSYSKKNCVDFARRGTGAYSDDRNFYFLEFLGAERLTGNGPPEGIWFEDLLKRELIGARAITGTSSEINAKQAYLRSWGYGDGEQNIQPFNTFVSGLLQWPRYDGKFTADAQRLADGVLMLVEPLYKAALFGLFAVDMITTTGMRINEAMQIRPAPDCLVRIKMSPPPEAKDQSPRIRYCLRLIPKGERTDTPHDFFIGEEQLRLMALVGKELAEHYKLHPGEQLPFVKFNSFNHRSFRFKQLQPYLFQFNSRHLSADAITVCMRFILHGISFSTKEGKNVIVKPHLLRHVFATHAVHVLKIPVEIVGGWLKQKDIGVTEYYSAPTDSILAEHHDFLLTRFAAQIDVGEAVLRSPEELQQAYNDAKDKVGTLAQVEGGHCVSHGFCAAKFACIGCAGKVVDPEKRYQIVHKKKWAQVQLKYTLKEGLYPEAERMKQLIRACDNEMAEMDIIEAYRRDGNRVAFIQIDDNK